MTAMILMHPNHWPAAKLIPNQEVEIYYKILRDRYGSCGISLTKAFMQANHTSKTRIDQKDTKNKELFGSNGKKKRKKGKTKT